MSTHDHKGFGYIDKQRNSCIEINSMLPKEHFWHKKTKWDCVVTWTWHIHTSPVFFVLTATAPILELQNMTRKLDEFGKNTHQFVSRMMQNMKKNCRGLIWTWAIKCELWNFRHLQFPTFQNRVFLNFQKDENEGSFFSKRKKKTHTSFSFKVFNTWDLQIEGKTDLSRVEKNLR